MLVRIDASSFDRQNLPICYKASNNFTVSYKLHSIDQIQQIKGLLQSIANATPVYLTRTPTQAKGYYSYLLYQNQPHRSSITMNQRLVYLNHC